MHRSWYRGEGGRVIYPRDHEGDGAPPDVTVVSNTTADGSAYVIKSLSGESLTSCEGAMAMMQAEIITHRDLLSSPAVPPLRDVIWDDRTQQVHMVFDYAGTPILDNIDCSDAPGAATRNEELAAFATAAFLDALGPLHAKGYSNNDVKPEQLLICDFGAVTMIGSDHVTGHTPHYFAPETHAALALGGGAAAEQFPRTFGAAHDVWAAVLSLYMIVTGGCHPYQPTEAEAAAPLPYPCFPGYGWEPHMAHKALTTPYVFQDSPAWGQVDPDMKVFVAAMLNPDPKARPTFEELRGTRWGRRCLALVQPASAGERGPEAGGLPAGGASPRSSDDDAVSEAEAAPAPEAAILSSAPSAVSSPCLDIFGDDEPSNSLPAAAAAAPELASITAGGCAPSGGGAPFSASLDAGDVCRCCEEPLGCGATPFEPITPPPEAPAAASEAGALRAALAALAGHAEADRAGRAEAEARAALAEERRCQIQEQQAQQHARIEELWATVAALEQQLCAAAAPPSSPCCKIDPPRLVSADCSSSGDSCPSTPRRAASGRRLRSLFSRSSSGGGAAPSVCSDGGASLCGGAPSDPASSAPKRTLLERGAHKVAKRLQQGLGRFACLLKGGGAATPSGV
ncbi:MAG: kinase-like domain-containing protein [Monoraphidium minutum]|nr:MAG: kinase-like domain-containing protein [Monoraphidium minutum]